MGQRRLKNIELNQSISRDSGSPVGELSSLGQSSPGKMTKAASLVQAKTPPIAANPISIQLKQASLPQNPNLLSLPPNEASNMASRQNGKGQSTEVNKREIPAKIQESEPKQQESQKDDDYFI